MSWLLELSLALELLVMSVLMLVPVQVLLASVKAAVGVGFM